MCFSDILSFISIFLFCCLLYFEFKRELMMFQQNSYRPERYSKWLKKSGDSTSISRLIAIFLALFSIASFGAVRFTLLLCIAFALCVTASLAKKRYKKPLAVTKRVLRLTFGITFIVAVLIVLAVLASVYGLVGKPKPLYAAVVCLLFVYCFSHIILLASYYLLKPVENHINQKFYNQAREKLRSMPGLKIIGITGSYGKTSTKHYLYRILSEHTETLMTPGSYNTTLGVVRTVNEHLKPYHEIFVVEMGAKQRGDIKEICDLVNPEMGIITSIGPQHLETFHTIENVRDTKFELVDSLPRHGKAFLNNDYSIIAERHVNNCECIRYRIADNDIEDSEKSAEFVAFEIKYNPIGTSFRLKGPNGFDDTFSTQLLGVYNIANLTGAIAVALELNIPIDTIKYAVANITPVEHRLSQRRLPSGIVILDDAFNSNPAGSRMAVEVLANFVGNRKIIITPGMIELGDRQYELNAELGQNIAKNRIDYAVIVGEYNKEAITEGLLRGGMNRDNILYFSTFLEANDWMIAFCKGGDVVLIENDLPDTFK